MGQIRKTIVILEHAHEMLMVESQHLKRRHMGNHSMSTG